MRVLNKLDQLWAAGVTDPDLIATQIAHNGWVVGADFTDEMCAEWQHQECCYVAENLPGYVHSKTGGWNFWFNNSASDRNYLRTGACKAIWFCRLTDYVEGVRPC